LEELERRQSQAPRALRLSHETQILLKTMREDLPSQELSSDKSSELSSSKSGKEVDMEGFPPVVSAVTMDDTLNVLTKIMSKINDKEKGKGKEKQGDEIEVELDPVVKSILSSTEGAEVAAKLIRSDPKYFDSWNAQNNVTDVFNAVRNRFCHLHHEVELSC